MKHIQPLAAIGAQTHGGFYGGEILLDGHAHGIIWAPKNEGQFKGMWLPEFEEIEARHCVDGLANTQAMAAAGSELAQSVLALRIDGHNDWHIPARDVLEQGYFYFKPRACENYPYWRSGENPSTIPPRYGYTRELPTQTAIADFQEGGAQAFDIAWYWSSAQHSAGSAWAQGFGDGDQDAFTKARDAVLVRAVRLIPIQ